VGRRERRDGEDGEKSGWREEVLVGETGGREGGGGGGCVRAVGGEGRGEGRSEVVDEVKGVG